VLVILAVIQVWFLVLSTLPNAKATTLTNAETKGAGTPRGASVPAVAAKESPVRPHADSIIPLARAGENSSPPQQLPLDIQTGTLPSNSTGSSPPPTADTIAVLGIVIAAVTLMLSLGTSSIATLQKRLQDAVMEIDDRTTREKTRNALIEHRLAVQFELLNYFRSTRGSESATATVYYLMPAFELLSSEKEDHRRKAYWSLRSYIGRAIRDKVPATWRYCIEVEHYLLSNKLANEGHTHCGIFDPSESANRR
jgi:hypothetical protein